MRSQITLSILNMRMRLAEPTKWDSFTVSAQVLLIWVVTPPPPSFSVSWHTFRSTNPPLRHSQLHSCLKRPALACQQALINPQHHPPIDFTHTHTCTESCFWVPTEVWQKPLDRWHTHLMLSGQGQRFSLLSDERLSLALFIYATGGERKEWQRESECFFLSLPYITRGEKRSKEKYRTLLPAEDSVYMWNSWPKPPNQTSLKHSNLQIFSWPVR